MSILFSNSVTVGSDYAGTLSQWGKKQITCSPPIFVPAPSNVQTNETESVTEALSYYRNVGVRDFICLPYYAGIPVTLYIKNLIHDSFFVLGDFTVLEFPKEMKEKLIDSFRSIHEAYDWEDTLCIVVQGVLAPFCAFDCRVPVNKGVYNLFDISNMTKVIIKENQSSSFVKDIHEVLTNDKIALEYWREYRMYDEKYLAEKYVNHDSYRRLFSNPILIHDTIKDLFSTSVFYDYMGNSNEIKFLPLYIEKRELENGHVHRYADLNDAILPIMSVGPKGMAYTYSISEDEEINPEPIYLFDASMRSVSSNYVNGIIIVPRRLHDRVSVPGPAGFKIRTDSFLAYIYGIEYIEDPMPFSIPSYNRRFLSLASSYFNFQNKLAEIPMHRVGVQNEKWTELVINCMNKVHGMKSMNYLIV